MRNCKKSRDTVPHDFLYVFRQVLRYSNQSLKNCVHSAQGRWHKILGREVTFYQKFVTLRLP